MIDLYLPPYEPPAIIREAPDLTEEAWRKIGLSLLIPFGGGEASAGGVQIFISDTYADTAVNSDTISTGSIALNTTCNSGDLIAVAFVAYDNDAYDGTTTMSLTGYTQACYTNGAHIQDFTVGMGGIFYKTASGGETTVSISGSIGSYSGTMDANFCKVFVVRGLGSNTPANTDTDLAGAGSITTTGASFLLAAWASQSGDTTMSGGGNVTNYTLGTFDSASQCAGYDDAPSGTSYTVTGGGPYGEGAPIALATWA